MHIIFVITSVIAILFIAPLAFLVVQSKGGYSALLFDQFQFYPMFWNSIFYALFISIVQIILAAISAFGLTCIKMKGKNVLFLLFIVLIMMPQQVTVLPNFISLRMMGLFNTRAGILLPSIFAPWGIVILFQYMKNMDISIIEAARIETNSLLCVLFQIVFPSIKEYLGVIFLFLFAESYNMLEQPLLFLKDDKLKTLSVFVSKADEYGENVMLSAAVIYMLPVLFLYLLFYNDTKKEMKYIEKNKI